MDYVVVYSGGLDSTVLLYDLLDQGFEVGAFSVDYGQRHKRELETASSICSQLKIRHKLLRFPSLSEIFGRCSLTDSSAAVPEGHYSEDSMKSTVVPNRNMILLALAGAWAIAEKAPALAYAAHGGDHVVYPDCRPEFVSALGGALRLADWHELTLECPYSSLSKSEIVRRGFELGVPFEETWSCYNGREKHCGKCGTCVARMEAFEISGVLDPTRYEMPEKMVCGV